MTVAERFWAKVLMGGPDECWPYVGALNADKYGVFRVDRNGVGLVYAHRLAWSLTNGPIPEGLEIMHTCPVRPRLRSCCNPAHLKPGTHEQNCQDLWHQEKRGRKWGPVAKQLAVVA
jgi:hypothetical protein